MRSFYTRVPSMCKHDKGFTLVPGAALQQDGYPGLWKCKGECGYYLPFDPDEFKNGIAFSDKPIVHDGVPTKVLPPLKTAM